MLLNPSILSPRMLMNFGTARYPEGPHTWHFPTSLEPEGFQAYLVFKSGMVRSENVAYQKGMHIDDCDLRCSISGETWEEGLLYPQLYLLNYILLYQYSSAN